MADIDLVSHLAELSKIHMTDEQLMRKAKEMNDIIALMDGIKEFNIDDEAESVNSAVRYEDLREDIVKESFPRREMTKNAKGESDGYFIVPKVVE